MKKALAVFVGTASIAAAGVVYFQAVPGTGTNFEGSLMDSKKPSNEDKPRVLAKDCYDALELGTKRCDKEDECKKDFSPCSELPDSTAKKCRAIVDVEYDLCIDQLITARNVCEEPHISVFAKCMAKISEGENCIGNGTLKYRICTNEVQKKEYALQLDRFNCINECSEEVFDKCKNECDDSYWKEWYKLLKESNCSRDKMEQREACLAKHGNPSIYNYPSIFDHSTSSDEMETNPDSNDSMMAPE